jgi:transcription initiation factor TFIID TATA-box-binding protein
MPELVSVVGGGDLGVELDLASVCADIEAEVKEYEPELYPALYLRFNADGATILAFASGKYNIAGAGSIEDLYAIHREFVRKVSELLDTEIEHEDECDLRNIVYREDFGSELRLEALIPLLRMENTEYEPEQFPALDYRPPEYNGLFKIFRTGKITLTGVTDPHEADEAFDDLNQKLTTAIESS